MRILSITLTLYCVCYGSAFGNQCKIETRFERSGIQKTYSAEQFYETERLRLVDIAGYAFSPDNEKILTGADRRGVIEPYIFDASDGSLLPMLEMSESKRVPISWFPDDNRALLSVDDKGDEQTHVVVISESNRIEDLTPGEGVRARFLGWARDGAGFYLESNDRHSEHSDLFFCF